MRNNLVLLLLVLLMLPSVIALSEDEAFSLAMGVVDVTSMASVYKMPDLMPGQKIFEYFTGNEIFQAGTDEYFVYLVDYNPVTPDGFPKHVVFVNKKTSYVLKVYLEFSLTGEDGQILSYESILVGSVEGVNGLQLVASDDSLEGDLTTITGFQAVDVGGGCPITCSRPKLDDRKPPKSFLIFIKGHDPEGVFDNSFVRANQFKKKFDEVTILSPYYDLGNIRLGTGSDKIVDGVKDKDGNYKKGIGYDDLSDIKKKISEVSSKVCCSDEVVLYVAAHGMAYFTVNISGTSIEDKRFLDFIIEIGEKYLDTDTGEMKNLTKEQLDALGLTYEEYYLTCRLIIFLATLYEEQEFSGYQLRDMVEAIQLLKNKVAFPDWFKKMFASSLDCLGEDSPELINSCIEKEFKSATKAKIKVRHDINGKKGKDIDTHELIKSFKDVASCNKQVIIDSCYGGAAIESGSGMSFVAPSKYLSFIDDIDSSMRAPSMANILEACKEIIPVPDDPAYFSLYGGAISECMTNIYKCKDPDYKLFIGLGYLSDEQKKLHEEFCKSGKNNSLFNEQKFVYKHKEKCDCCPLLETISLVGDGEEVLSVSIDDVLGGGLEDVVLVEDASSEDLFDSDFVDDGVGKGAVVVEGVESEEVSLMQRTVDESGALNAGPIGLSVDFVGEAWLSFKQPNSRTRILSTGLIVVVLFLVVFCLLRKRK